MGWKILGPNFGFLLFSSYIYPIYGCHNVCKIVFLHILPMEKASEVLTMVIASGFEVRSMSFTRIYRVLEKLM